MSSTQRQRDSKAETLNNIRSYHNEILLIMGHLNIVSSQSSISALEADLDEAREVFHRLSKPLIRKLTIDDLPDEILLRVFENLEGYDRQAADCIGARLGKQGTPGIKNSRLVCRRFHNLASQFLIRLVTVKPNEASLARLERISRHPMISKGVVEVQLHLDLHSRDLEALADFASYLGSEISEAVRTGYRYSPLSATATESDEWHRKGQFLASLQAMLGRFAPAGEDTGWYSERFTARPLKDPRRHYHQLLEVHGKYVEILQHEEEVIESGRLGKTLAEAMARMPLARSLSLDDGFQHFHRRAREDLFVDEEQIWDAIEVYMLEPKAGHFTTGERRNSCGFIIPMLDAMRAAGVFLKAFDMRLSNPTDFEALQPRDSTVSHSQLSTAMHRLRSFSLTYTTSDMYVSDVNALERFLAAILDTNSLQSLRIQAATPGNEDETHPLLINMTDILLHRVYRDNLREISLNSVLVEPANLVEFLRGLPTPMNSIALTRITMCEGPWAELLDELRDKQCPRVSLLAPLRIGGAKETIPSELRDYVFGRYGGLSRAETYVTSGTAALLTRNPVGYYYQLFMARQNRDSG